MEGAEAAVNAVSVVSVVAVVEVAAVPSTSTARPARRMFISHPEYNHSHPYFFFIPVTLRRRSTRAGVPMRASLSSRLRPPPRTTLLPRLSTSGIPPPSTPGVKLLQLMPPLPSRTVPLLLLLQRSRRLRVAVDARGRPRRRTTR